MLNRTLAVASAYTCGCVVLHLRLRCLTLV
ncbi:DUF3678 domain-containing protein [Bacteroides cellulosilyticus]|nr:DUF3678 domain-containing protein [Bacteroides cellulosilyticus]